MNIEKIKFIIENRMIDNSAKTKLILDVIAEDENAVPYVLAMLAYERSSNVVMIREMNNELSRSYVTIDEPHLMKRDFQLQNINNLWEKYKDRKIGNNFKV